MISGTVGEAAAAEFALISDEIHAGVAVDALLSAPRGDRNDMFPNHLHGLTALIYALPSAVNEDTVSAAIEILADLRGLTGTGLPVSELATFGFEILIAKAIEQGWQAAFAVSPDYAEYAKSRQDAGLP